MSISLALLNLINQSRDSRSKKKTRDSHTLEPIKISGQKEYFASFMIHLNL